MWGPKHLDVTRCRHSCKIWPEFPIVLPNQRGWCVSIQSCFAKLLRHPEIGRTSCHIHMDDLPRFQIDEEESQARTGSGEKENDMVEWQKWPIEKGYDEQESVLERHMNESFEELCTMLRSSNKEQCHHAIFRLCTAYPSQSAVLILTVVREKDEDTRDQARRWLRRRGGEEAAKALLPYLHDEEGWVRMLVTLMLYHVRDEQIAFPALFASLQDPAWSIRCQAVNILGRWKDVRQVGEKLALCLREDLDPLVRIGAAEALGEPADPRGVEPLVASLQRLEMAARLVTANALGKVGDERAIQPLLACLQDREEEVHIAAASALKEVGDRRIVPMVVPALQDTAWQVRLTVVKMLQEWGDEQVVEPLLVCLERESVWLVRTEICKALGALEDQRAINPLIACQRDQNEAVRRQAVWALGKLGNERARDPLTACLSDEDEWVRSVATKALARLRQE